MNNSQDLSLTYQQVLDRVQRFLPYGSMKQAAEILAKKKRIKVNSAYQYLVKVKSGGVQNLEALAILNDQVTKASKQL